MRLIALTATVSLLVASSSGAGPQRDDETYLTWTAKQAESTGRQGYREGRVGGFGPRLLKTERAFNYKVAATWLSGEIIRATARQIQLQSRMSDEETRALVRAADLAGDTVIMIDIDPNEGSGVIPLSWEAFLQPRDEPARAVRGRVVAALRDVRALAGVSRRNYDYDRFWVTFPLLTSDGRAVFSDRDSEAELAVRIHDREGRIRWPIPRAVRHRQQLATLPPPSVR